MPMPDAFSEHPTPAQAYELGVNFATLLRHLFNHPEFYYQEPPTAAVSKMDPVRTPKALFFTADFVQNTYVNHVLPYLPQGATRKCKELGNPWAYADPNYQWEWTWDAGAGVMKDTRGNVIQFPTLPKSRLEDNNTDLHSRNFLAMMLICENMNDPKAQELLGGRSFDFGDDVRTAMEKI
ncbi:hypothetical protein GGR50DRAFT_624972 [Xylaria sp. CBS 124048]|nr:hypothetical protein GGR50DRAFT_624972 [Xylaria sp. CBS 124048]